MAERRMFTRKITDDDNFTSLSASAQALYFQLSMSADDDGFCNQVSLSMFKSHASIADLEQLLSKRYLYQFDNGVIVIKHWRMANALRKDRYTPTAFQEELKRLQIEENGSYTWKTDNKDVESWLPDGCQVVASWLPQDSIDKDSIENNNNIDTNVSICQTERTVHSDIQSIVDAWNSLSAVGISPVSSMSSTSKRYKSISARIREYGVDSVLKAIENVRESEFLQGKNNRNWMITFDWFALPNNFPKVLEGNYNKKNRSDTEYKRGGDEWQ